MKIQSKVMKAAWTIWRKRDAKTWSQAMTKAWAWAKKNTQKMVDLSKVVAVKETEKATAYRVRVACNHLEVEKFGFVWIPKSMIVNGQIPEWFAFKKLDEAAEMLTNGYSNHSRVDCRFYAL